MKPQWGDEESTVWQVEALRGVAAWMVIYAHYWSGADSSWGVLRFTFTGVDLFFVLSGFVFAPYFFGRPLQVGAFAVRRFFRIYPAYLLALLTYFGIKLANGQALAYWWQHLLFAYLQSREMAFYYNAAFWSLPSEIEFYLLVPLLARFCSRRPAGLAALFVTALVMRALLGYASDRETQNLAYIAMHHLPGMLVEFLLGVGAWRVFKQGLNGWTRAVLFVAGFALWLVLAAVFAKMGDARLDDSLLRGHMSWLAALAFALMVAACLGAWLRVHPLLIWAALWAGRLSYGCYLFHWAALQVLTPYALFFGALDVTFAAALLTLFVAWLSYQLWENPWRKFGRSLGTRQKVQ